MYHAILRATGKVERIECDLRDIDSKIREKDILLFSANSLGEYQRELAKDPNGRSEPQ